MTACEVCGIPLGHYETCPSPSCPCYGLRGGSPEMDAAAERWRSRPSVAQARAMGDDVLAALERDAWLELGRAAGDLIDIEIRHLEEP